MLREAMLWFWSILWAGITYYTLAIFFTIILLYVIHWINTRRFQHTLFHRLGIPYVKPHLIYGNMHELRGKALGTYVIGDWLKKHGKVYGYYVGSKPYLVVGDLDLVRQVLVKDFHNFSNRPKLAIEAQPVMNTIVGLRDQRWKEVRSVLASTFSMVKMKQMVGIMNLKVDEFLGIISEKITKDQPLEWYSLIQGLTLDVISECALAMKTNCQRDQNTDELFVAVRSFLRNAINPAIYLAIYFDVFGKVFSFISNRLALSGRMTNMIVSHLKTVLHIRRKDISTKYIDVLQMMLEAADSAPETFSNGTVNPDDTKKIHDSSNKTTKEKSKLKKLSDDEIIANAWVFLLGGFETTANSLTSTVYLLACYPDIQERLFQEISEFVEDGYQPLSYDTVKQLTYLDQVFCEALRLYPPVVSFITRETNQDFQLGNYFIPSNTNILVPIWQIHRDPELWPDPEKFDPDRFSLEVKASETRHPMSYIPFGAGPRSCVGIRFAQLEAKLTLARLVRCFRLETCDETPIPLTFEMPTVTHIPSKAVKLRAFPRE